MVVDCIQLVSLVDCPNQKSMDWAKFASIKSNKQTEMRGPVWENDRSDREQFETSGRARIAENLKILDRLGLTRVRIRTVQDFQTFCNSGPAEDPKIFPVKTGPRISVCLLDFMDAWQFWPCTWISGLDSPLSMVANWISTTLISVCLLKFMDAIKRDIWPWLG